MKFYYAPILFLVACSSSVETKELKPIEKKLPYHMVYPEPPEDNRVTCRIIKSVVEIKDCKLYTFTCEDDSEELYLSCSIQPIGEITNPPRPI